MEFLQDLYYCVKFAGLYTVGNASSAVMTGRIGVQAVTQLQSVHIGQVGGADIGGNIGNGCGGLPGNAP